MAIGAENKRFSCPYLSGVTVSVQSCVNWLMEEDFTTAELIINY